MKTCRLALLALLLLVTTGAGSARFTITGQVLAADSFAGGTAFVVRTRGQELDALCYHDQPDGRGTALAVVCSSLRWRHWVKLEGRITPRGHEVDSVEVRRRRHGLAVN